MSDALRRPPRPSRLADVLEAYDVLDAWGLRPCLFGGWAKALHGVWRHGAHGDVDLLVRAADISAIDEVLRAGAYPEFAPKRHVHKRGFWLGGVLVELTHLRPTPEGWATDFYGRLLRRWPEPLACRLPAAEGRSLEVATAETIIAYERNHGEVEAAFYAAFPEARERILALYGDTRMPYAKRFPAP